MARRGNGEGTMQQRADGRWEARLSLGYVDGRRARKSVFGKTQGEVRQKLTRLLRDHDQGMPIAADERQPLATYLVRWLDDAARNTVRPRTLDGYQRIIGKHLAPAIGRIPLAKLAPADVQALLNAKSRAGLAPQTVRNVHAVLRRALGQALRWGLVGRNVATLVELPRIARSEVRALSPADAKAILAAVRGDRLEGLVNVTLATGLRQGEALALRWRDVDLEAGTITVRHTLQRLGGAQLVEPKTMRSRRALAASVGTVAALRAHRTRQLQERLWAGSRWSEGDYVFTSTIGTPMVAGEVTRRFQQLLAAAGLPRMRFHDLRHGAASLLLAQGIHPRVVMEMLGHSTIAVTMNVYSHVTPALQREAADRMDGILSG
ncbi:MAG: site-specific integrase [Chloroflexota bacterium]|nr:site-specific integrase [Chloroflexota bacterium]